MSRTSGFPTLVNMLRQMELDDHMIFPLEKEVDIRGLRKCMTNAGRRLECHFKSILSDRYLHIVRIK